VTVFQRTPASLSVESRRYVNAISTEVTRAGGIV
jgi:hypothetical protein